jgi:polysaccharide biosynthesis protein PslG
LRLIVILVVMLVALFMAAESQAVTKAQLSSLSPAPSKFYGMIPTSSHLGDTQSIRELNYFRMKRGGMTWTRVLLPWHVIHRNAYVYDWAKYDTQVAAAVCQGLEVQLQMWGTPAWLVDGGPATSAPPMTHLHVYRNFVTAAVNRYGATGAFWKSGAKCANGQAVPNLPVRVWQMWNEPNAKQFWGGAPNPGQYAKLLQAGRQGVQASINPKAKVMMAGLTGDHEGGAVQFLRQLYTQTAAPINANFDILAMHPYAPWPKGSLDMLSQARSILNEKGASTKPMWITEIGWSSCKESGGNYSTYCASNKNGLISDEATQNWKLDKAYLLYREHRATLRLQRVGWYNWVDYVRPETDMCPWCEGAGALRKDGTAKPAWVTMTQFTGGKP